MFEEAIRGLETVRDAISERDKEKALAELTNVLMQIVNLFGHDANFFGKWFPFMENLKELIRSGAYDDALPLTLAMLARFRQAQGFESGVSEGQQF